MAIEHVIKEQKDTASKYPKIRVNKRLKYVVLFTRKNEGIVVAAEHDSPYPVGHSADNWVDHDEPSWLPCEVTLRSVD